MSRLVDFYEKYLTRLNKYWLVTILFLFITFFIGDGNLYNRYKYDEKIRTLKNEINRYKKEIEQDKKKLQELQTDKVGLEQFAREEYLMKKEDEDLFIVEE
ncbi:MAG: septum formation initiator family protein [Tannerella sp.]|jgi:cell division protein FtsB|nr:septum formation initiator family protein [Tannerella sp.]